MTCRNIQPLLSAYLDRELGGDEMLDIRSHLRDCEECRFELENLVNLKRLLTGLEAPETPAGFEERLLATVIQDRPVACFLPRRRVGAALAFAGVAACSMAATLIVMASLDRAPVAAPPVGNSAMAREISRDRVFS
ncbi:MAG TPA: zf-HC2 domain-containing protein, partial [Fimbriimonas sp.]